MRMDGLEDVRAIERHNGHCAEIRGEESEDDAEGQSGEQILAYSKEKRHREKYDDRNQHDGQHRESYFVGAVNGGDLRLLAEFDVPVDVLEDDDGIVDQARKRQRQAAQDHAVDRPARHMENEKRDHHGKRNRQKNRRCGPKAPEENQNHDCR